MDNLSAYFCTHERLFVPVNPCYPLANKYELNPQGFEWIWVFLGDPGLGVTHESPDWTLTEVLVETSQSKKSVESDFKQNFAGSWRRRIPTFRFCSARGFYWEKEIGSARTTAQNLKCLHSVLWKPAWCSVTLMAVLWDFFLGLWCLEQRIGEDTQER